MLTIKLFLFQQDLLGTLEVSVYNLVLVEIVHTSGQLLGPLHQLLGVNLLAVP